MHKAYLLRALFLLSLAVAAPVFAQSPTDTLALVQDTMNEALDAFFTELESVMLRVLFLFLLVQFIWTNWHHFFEDSDVSKVMMKLFSGLFWAGICLYIFDEGADFIKGVASWILNLAANLSGSTFDPIYPVETGIRIATKMMQAVDKTQGILGSLNIFPALLMALIALVILAASAIIAFRILMIFIETKIVIAFSPIAFALLGLNALRDQGFTPFKYLVSMAYRALLMGAIVATMAKFGDSIISMLSTLPASSDPSIWGPLFVAAIGFTLLAGIAWNSNAIAASLASGSSAMTSSDMGGPAAIAGAIAGAGIAMGAQSVGAASGATTGVRSMADFMRSLNGDIRDVDDNGRFKSESDKSSSSSSSSSSSDSNKSSSSGGGGGDGDRKSTRLNSSH